MTWLLMSLMLFPATGNTAERHSLFEKGEEVVTFVPSRTAMAKRRD